eukprot:8346297-Alexandrium_andersonii.AAC.1
MRARGWPAHRGPGPSDCRPGLPPPGAPASGGLPPKPRRTSASRGTGPPTPCWPGPGGSATGCRGHAGPRG